MEQFTVLTNGGAVYLAELKPGGGYEVIADMRHNEGSAEAKIQKAWEVINYVPGSAYDLNTPETPDARGGEDEIRIVDGTGTVHRSIFEMAKEEDPNAW
jgi:hypothetical protein